jgi:hypothetical protein
VSAWSRWRDYARAQLGGRARGAATTVPVRIFQIGFNKCGTRTIDHFFGDNGFRTAHWKRGRLARAIYANLTNGRSLIAGFEEVEVFTDMEFVDKSFAFEAFKLFPYLAAEFPDAVFILNTRNRDDWIRSRISHDYGRYVRRWKAILDVESDAELIDRWIADWDDHHARVRAFFQNRPQRLIEFELGKTPPEVFAQAIPERAFDLSRLQVHGKTPEDRRRVEHELGRSGPPPQRHPTEASAGSTAPDV